MLPITPRLRQQVLSARSMRAKVDVLHNAYAGETAWVVATSPAMNRIDTESLREFLRDRLVIVVKHAYDLVPNLADHHLLNANKLRGYDYATGRAPIVWYEYQNPQEVPTQGDIHLLLTDKQKYGCYANSILSVAQDFDSCLLRDQVCRRYGPSIMFSTGLYVLLHFGVRRIVSMGIDMTGEEHYFPDSEPVGDGVKSWARQESEDAARALPAWRDWLRSHGVSWLRVDTSPEPTRMCAIPCVSIPEIMRPHEI